MIRLGILASSVLALALAGCAEDGRIPNQTIGLVVGSMAGAALGSSIGNAAGQAAVAVGGTLAGGLIGSSLGAKLDNNDRVALNRTTNDTLEKERSGVSRPWRNPDTGVEGAVTADPAYKNADGRNCRPFSQTARVGGEDRIVRGTACRGADGSWQIVEK